MSEGLGRVAVIGGGPAGVCAVKCCVDEGLVPTCYEQHDDIGGAWYYTEHVRPNQGAGSYEKLVTNTSKEMSCFSDFPMPDNYPQFVSVHQYHEYLHKYADHFDLKKYIRFNHSVTKITPAPSFKADGRWRVYVREYDDSCIRVETYDHVMVCTGPFRKPKIPAVKGMKLFKGKIMHMHQYRTRETFIGKKVVVVGNQASAAEAVVEAASVTRPVWLATKHKFYCVGRYLPNGVPGDVRHSRHSFCHKPARTLKEFKKSAEQSLPKGFEDTLPEEMPFQGGCCAFVDGFSELLERRQVQVKPQIDYLTENEVVFEDGTVLDNVDIILFATGYLPDYDIIDIHGITGVRDRMKFDLYLWMFPTFLEHTSLAIVDMTPLYQSQWTVMELQARLAARVFSGKHQLPDRNTMRKYISVKRQYFIQKCGGKFQVNQEALFLKIKQEEIKEKQVIRKIQILPIEFQEELAEELGVQPSFWRLFWMNPLMAYKCHYGPALPIIYRLVGPGWKKEAWEGYDAAIKRMLELPWDEYKNKHHRPSIKGVLLGLPVITGLSILGVIVWIKYR